MLFYISPFINFNQPAEESARMWTLATRWYNAMKKQNQLKLTYK